MPDGVVLVMNDEWMARLLAPVLGDAGFSVSTAASPREAMPTIRAGKAAAIVVDAGLRGDAATRLIGEVRADTGLRGVVILLLCHAEDPDTRIEGLGAGADACVGKPFRSEEVVAAIRALLALGTRIRASTTRVLDPWDAPPLRIDTQGASALEGDLAELSLATVLTMLELERRSGVLVVDGLRQAATVELAGGAAVHATLAGSAAPPLSVLRRVMKWKTGRFVFRPGQSTEPPDDRSSIGALLIEAARLDDESAPSSMMPPPPASTPAPSPFDEHEAPTARGDSSTNAQAPSSGSGPNSRRARRSTTTRGSDMAPPPPAAPAPPAPRPAATTRPPPAVPRPPVPAPPRVQVPLPRPVFPPPRPPPPKR